MDNLQSLVDKVYKEKLNEAADKGLRMTAFAVYGQIIYNTPVGNPDLWKTKYPPKGYVGGRARANWNIDLNKINNTITESTDAPDVNKPLGYKCKITDIIYISNHLPYIQRLNDGWSTQAPENFVETAVIVGTRQAQELMK